MTTTYTWTKKAKVMNTTYLLKSNRLCVKNVSVNSRPENMNKYRKYMTDICWILWSSNNKIHKRNKVIITHTLLFHIPNFSIYHSTCIWNLYSCFCWYWHWRLNWWWRAAIKGPMPLLTEVQWCMTRPVVRLVLLCSHQCLENDKLVAGRTCKSLPLIFKGLSSTTGRGS